MRVRRLTQREWEPHAPWGIFQEQDEGRGHCGRKEGQVVSGGLQEGGFQESPYLLHKHRGP